MLFQQVHDISDDFSSASGPIYQIDKQHFHPSHLRCCVIKENRRGAKVRPGGSSVFTRFRCSESSGQHCQSCNIPPASGRASSTHSSCGHGRPHRWNAHSSSRRRSGSGRHKHVRRSARSTGFHLPRRFRSSEVRRYLSVCHLRRSDICPGASGHASRKCSNRNRVPLHTWNSHSSNHRQF